VGGVQHIYDHGHPVIAADGQYVYVAWDLDDRLDNQCGDNRSGIRFRVRTTVTDVPHSGGWVPELLKEERRLSRVNDCRPDVDGWPAMDSSGGQTYIVWEHLGDELPLGAYDIYTYSLQYRVFGGFQGEQEVWWPSAAGEYELPAAAPWDLNSLYAEALDHAYYSGVRPAIRLENSGGSVKPHLVWHAWTPPSDPGGGGGEYAELDVELQSDELYVTEDWPYQVYYGYGTYGTPGDPSSIEWAAEPTLIAVRGEDRIMSWPDLALASYDGGASYHPHFVLHWRPFEKTLVKQAWYTNLDDNDWISLPAVMQGAAP
jgi:hypothetical protein